MGRTVRELLDDLDAAELQEWLAYYALDPWTEDRADLRAGVVAAVVANVNSKRGRFKPSDFMPRYGPPRKRSGSELRGIAERWNAVLGGIVRARKTKG